MGLIVISKCWRIGVSRKRARNIPRSPAASTSKAEKLLAKPWPRHMVCPCIKNGNAHPAAEVSWPEFLFHLLAGVVWRFFIAGGIHPVLAQRPLGVDVSHSQGVINWTSTKSSGVSFAWAKATESSIIHDADFILNEANAVAAGVLIGAYHFAHPETHIGT